MRTLTTCCFVVSLLIAALPVAANVQHAATLPTQPEALHVVQAWLAEMTATPDAMRERGLALLQAGVTRADQTAGFALLRRAADAGDRAASAEVGYHYLVGSGQVERNPQRALPYLEAAESLRQPRNDHALGIAYVYVHAATPEATAKACVLFERAAYNDYADAAYMAVLCHEDRVAGRDPKNAITFARIGANLGHGGAQYDLARFYENGVGVAADFAAAARYYARATETARGDTAAAAAEALARLYSRGKGVARSYPLAETYLTQAAVGGRPTAQFLLAALYFSGKYISRQPAVCYAWLLVAAEAKHKEARESLEEARESFTAAELAAGEALAAVWTQGKPMGTAAGAAVSDARRQP